MNSQKSVLVERFCGFSGSSIIKVYYLFIFINKYMLSHMHYWPLFKKDWIFKSLAGKFIFSEWKATIERNVFFTNYETAFSFSAIQMTKKVKLLQTRKKQVIKFSIIPPAWVESIPKLNWTRDQSSLLFKIKLKIPFLCYQHHPFQHTHSAVINRCLDLVPHRPSSSLKGYFLHS